MNTTITNESLAACRTIITDEWLDYMGERYRRLGIRYWTGVEFHKYLLCPDVIEAEADKKRGYLAGHLLCGDRSYVIYTTN